MPEAAPPRMTRRAAERVVPAGRCSPDRRPDLRCIPAWPGCAWRRRWRRCARAMPPWAVGILLGLFAAAPIVLALGAGRLADRHGYHLPIRVAVGLTVAGGLCAVAATFSRQRRLPRALPRGDRSPAPARTIGLIAIQRTAGRMAGEATELKRIFSWLGLAPALANVVGPVLAGVLIDLSGFAPRLRRARAAAAREPGLGAPGAARGAGRPVAAGASASNAWNLLRAPGFTAPAAGQLAALVELGRAQLPGARPRPRARLLRLGDRPRARRLRRLAVAAVRLRHPVPRASPGGAQGAGRRDAHRRRRLRGLSVRPRGLGDGRLRRLSGLRPGRGAADDHDDAAPDHAAHTGTARRSPCARWRSTCRAR